MAGGLSADSTLSTRRVLPIEPCFRPPYLHNRPHTGGTAIAELAILPGYRGGRIGRKLLGGVERKARELGCCGLTLEVQEINQKAKGLYESAGFSQYGSGAIFLKKRFQ